MSDAKYMSLEEAYHSENGQKMVQELEKPFDLSNDSTGKILAEPHYAQPEEMTGVFLKLNVKVPDPDKRQPQFSMTFTNLLTRISVPSFFERAPEPVANLFRKVCIYSIHPQDPKTKDKEAAVLSQTASSLMVLLGAIKGSLSLSNKGIDQLAFWITRKDNSPIIFLSGNKYSTKLSFGSIRAGAVPSNFSAADLASFIFTCNRLPTVPEANQFYLKQQELIGKERE